MRLIDDGSECNFLDRRSWAADDLAIEHRSQQKKQKENQSLIFFSLAEIFRDSELGCAISRACEHVNPREMATVIRCFMTKLDDASATRSLSLTTIAKPMNRFAACGDPRAVGAQESKDDQGRNDRLVQIGPEGLAASAHVMGRPRDRAPYWGYRR